MSWLCLQVWDVTSLQRVDKILGHRGTVRAMLVHKGRLITGSDDSSIGVWDVPRRERLATLYKWSMVRGLAVVGDVLVSVKERTYPMAGTGHERTFCLYATGMRLSVSIS